MISEYRDDILLNLYIYILRWLLISNVNVTFIITSISEITPDAAEITLVLFPEHKLLLQPGPRLSNFPPALASIRISLYYALTLPIYLIIIRVFIVIRVKVETIGNVLAIYIFHMNLKILMTIGNDTQVHIY